MAIPPKPNNPNAKRPLPTPPKKPMGGHESESEESHAGGKRPLPMPPKPGANKPGMPPKPGARPLPTPPKKPMGGQQRERESES